MKELTGEGILSLPLRLHGVELGRPVDALLDRDGLRVVGLDVLCGDEVHRFLPLPTAVVSDDSLAIHSPLVLLEEDELDFYRNRTFSLKTLRGRAVTRKERRVGTLCDIVFARSGDLLAVLLESGERIPYEGALGLAPERRTAA
jgi:hypothetical protein